MSEEQPKKATRVTGDPKRVEVKLLYLAELRQLSFRGAALAGNNIDARIAKVCDSIESDLSI